MSNMAIFTIWSFFKGHEVNLHTLEKSFRNNWLACDWGRKALPRATLCASGHILLHKAPWDIRVPPQIAIHPILNQGRPI